MVSSIPEVTLPFMNLVKLEIATVCAASALICPTSAGELHLSA
jgi:hypothetical protein